MLPQVEDLIEKLYRLNVICRIPCADCLACYVGMTLNQLRTRLASHRCCFNRLGKTVEDEEIVTLRERTALLDHSIGHYQTIDFGNTQILDSSRKKPNLPTLETCHHINTPNTVNRRTDTTDNLNSTYTHILHTLRNNSMAEQLTHRTHGTHGFNRTSFKVARNRLHLISDPSQERCLNLTPRKIGNLETWSPEKLPSQVQKNAHHGFQ